MSARDVIWARDQRLPAPQKVVLLILASHVNAKTGDCFPSQETLALETGLSRRAVQIAVKKLEKSKHIQAQKKRNSGGQWATCHYRLNTAHHAHEVRTDRSKKTAHGDKAHHAHEVRTKGYTNTSDSDLSNVVALRVACGVRT